MSKKFTSQQPFRKKKKRSSKIINYLQFPGFRI